MREECSVRNSEQKTRRSFLPILRGRACGQAPLKCFRRARREKKEVFILCIKKFFRFRPSSVKLLGLSGARGVRLRGRATKRVEQRFKLFFPWEAEQPVLESASAAQSFSQAIHSPKKASCVSKMAV